MKFPDKEWLDSVCQIGKGARCCRYLMVSGRGWECAKEQDGNFKEMIDKRVEAGTFTAQGDNCDGPSSPQRILN